LVTLQEFSMRTFVPIVAFSLFSPAFAADAPRPAGKYPLRIPAPHGEVILPTEGAKKAHDDMRYASIRRVDDMLYLSGQIVGRRDDEGNDAAAFKLQVRRGIERLKATLAAAGASFADVVMINSFHVWDSPHFDGTREQHFAIVEEVMGEFMKPPYPAWTAVGTTGLLWDRGLIEIHLIARVP
jgi:enamine deaminase RidA (YjgF/YER057c/UK114 family)